MFGNVLSAIDLFGVPVIIHFSGKEKSKSRFGGVCSILFCFFLIWAVYNGCKELFSTDNPQTVNSESYTDTPREMTLSPEGFPIAIRLLAPQNLGYAPLPRNRYYSMYLVYDSLHRIRNSTGQLEDNWVSRNISTELCQPKHFGDHYSLFSSLDLTETYCLSEDSISLEGAFASMVYKSLSIYVHSCNNITSNFTCAPQAEINQYLEAAWFNILYANMVIDPSNYDHPDSRFQDVYATVVSPNTQKTTPIYLSHLDVLTDVGWLTQDIRNLGFIKVADITESSLSKSAEDVATPLMFCYFEVSKLESRYTRSYKKIQTVLAEVASLANTCLFVLLIATSKFLKMKFRETLMNELFHISLDDKPPKKRKNKSKSNKHQASQDISCSTGFPKESPLKGQNDMRRDEVILELPQVEDKHNKAARSLKINTFNDLETKFHPLNESREDKSSLKIVKPSRSILKKKSETPKNTPTLFSSAHSRCYSFSEESQPQIVTLQKPNITSMPSLAQEKRSPPRTNLHLISSKEEEEIKLNCETQNDQNSPPRFLHTSTILLPESVNTESNRGVTETRFKESAYNNLSVVRENSDEKREGHEYKIKYSGQRESEDNGGSGERDDEELNEEMFDLEKKSDKVTLSVWEYLTSFVYRPKQLKKKLQILDEGVKNINLRLDVLNILNKLKDIDKIRALLFDQDQLVLFNNLPKPELTIRNNALIMKQYTFSDKGVKHPNEVVGSEQQLVNSFKRIRHKEDKTIIDERLLAIFGKQIKYDDYAFIS